METGTGREKKGGGEGVITVACSQLPALPMFVRRMYFYKIRPYLHVQYTEMPTSTFLLYLVRFLKGNTAVRFLLQKYVFSIFFFFFFYTGEWKFYITHIIYVMKTWSEFLNNVKK